MQSQTHPATFNIQVLKEYLPLLRDIDIRAYQYTRTSVFPSSLGAHLRHDLDHYLNFLQGLPERRIDYETRSRNVRIAEDPAFALETVEDIVQGLERIPTAATTSLSVRVENGSGAACWVESNLRREMDFLLSHSIHHQAIISMILRDQGLQTHAAFGVAPSTLRFQQQLSCAQ